MLLLLVLFCFLVWLLTPSEPISAAVGAQESAGVKSAMEQGQLKFRPPNSKPPFSTFHLHIQPGWVVVLEDASANIHCMNFSAEERPNVCIYLYLETRNMLIHKLTAVIRVRCE